MTAIRCALSIFVLLVIAGEVDAAKVVSSVGTETMNQAVMMARAMKQAERRIKRRNAQVDVFLRGSRDDDSSDDDDDDDDDDDMDDKDISAKGPAIVTAAEGLERPAEPATKAAVVTAPSTPDEAAESAKPIVAAAKVTEEEKEAAKAAKEAEKKAEELAKEKEKRRLEAEKKRLAAKIAVQAAKSKKRQAASDLKNFNDDYAFDMKVSAETRLISNETQSPALASFLGSLRTEMRDYAMPAYPKYLEGKLQQSNAKVETLEKKLDEVEKKEGKAEETEEKKEKDKKEKKPPTASEDTAASAAASGKPPWTEDKEKKEGKKEGEAIEASDNAVGKAHGSVVEARQGVAKNVDDATTALTQTAGHTWALSFFANVALMAAVFAMSQASDKNVSNYTLFMIDQVVAVFLAVMYFQAFDSLLDFHGLGVASHVLCTILHACFVLGSLLAVAIALRKSELWLAILCGAGAHIAAFSSIHAAATVQNKVWVSTSYTYTMCVFGLMVLALGLALVGYLVLTVKRQAGVDSDDAFMDKTDDMENDFGAMAFSVCFTMFIRFLISGHHPVDDDSEFDHTHEQRTAMMFYAIFCLIVATFAVGYLSKKAAEASNYATKRVLTFLITVTTMNVAWAFLYWGEWTFFETFYKGQAIKGRVMFAILASFLGGVGLIGLSKLPQHDERTKKVALTALALVVAWSWELCFDAAVEDMAEGVAHPWGWKVAATVVLFSIVLPVYAYSLKPISEKAAKAIGA